MDGVTLLALASLGGALGLLTGLVPGLHVNTLAAVALAAWPSAGPAAVVVLVAVGTAHTFVSILPATYLGAPGEDTALSVLPAHRLLRLGQGPEAVRLSVHASLLGLLGALAATGPLRWVLPRVAPWLDRSAPWLLVAALLALLSMEAPRGRSLRAVGVMALAAWVGLLAFEWPVRAFVSVPASPLLPLLSGLFGVPTLVASLHHRAAMPLQEPCRSWSAPTGLRRRDVVPGVAACAVTAVLPGVTGGVATSLVRAGQHTDDPRPVLAVMSVVNTAHAVLALAMLWLLGRSRSGLAEAVVAMAAPEPWRAGPPPGMMGLVGQAVLAAGVVGAVGTLWLDRPVRSVLERSPWWTPQALGLACIVALTAVLTGAWGLALLGASAAVGSVPLALGVRRVHLAAALLVPITVRLWT